jgi:hypothetical protein
MALRDDIETLRDRQDRLCACLTELRISVVEDRPRARDLALADVRADALDDLLALAMESAAAAADALQDATRPVDPPAVGRAILRCQELQDALAEKLGLDLLAFERIAELRAAARRHGREWASWASSVESSLQGCADALRAVGVAVLACWRGWMEWSDIEVSSLGRKAPAHRTAPISKAK